ncbi:hypothetical protein RHSIM_Rhsim04G0098900 [Rhododendron simsii]|uniref:Protein kinase domain-containing protein n=1 Tax=Rhododendron simsii TaxID=118357 RepID=A0A834H367_RHOSS|nr:hypothetical protein RHSIM_Rhsim04G0098900 [Rhododendron simsii]
MTISSLTNSIAISIISSLLLFTSLSSSSSLSPDGLSLLALKSAISSDPTHALTSWSSTDPTPCHWTGITCDHTTQLVTSISLPNKALSGYLPSELASLLSLRRLSLSNNSLSGPIPTQISSLQKLTHLDLSSNLLSGSLPECLINLTHLAGTLNLSYNRFSGEVPPAYGRFPVELSLDLRHNNLTGKIPQVGSLLNQGPTAFSGNPNLCGFPLNSLCPDPEAQNPNNPNRVFSNPENPRNPGVGFVSDGGRKNGSVIVSVVSGIAVVIGVVFVSALVFRRKWRRSEEGRMGREEKLEKEVEVEVSEEGQKGKFVVVDEGFGLELEDLLRASAYVVGKSRSGIVYRVVAGRGSGGAGAMVAVRRLSEADATWRFKEFEAEVEAIGRVQHPNIVRLRAYYYASDEKLLVSEFIRNGSLYTALHGGPAEPSPLLSWAARLKIAQGIARGLTHIHECSPRKHVHGNIKSSKILLDDDLHPYISGFGLARLVQGTSKSINPALKKHNLNQVTLCPKSIPSSSVIYTAPEVRVLGSKLTQKSDVYSFGIVLLEMLTGCSPESGLENDGKGLESLVRRAFREEKPLSEIIDSTLVHEVHAKKQVIAAFHVALNCTEPDPEVRPRMRTVCDSLDRIKSQ